MLVYEHARITKSTTYAPLSTGVTHSPHKEWQRMPVPTGADSWKCQLPLCQATDHSVRLCPRSLVSSCCSPWAQYHPSLPSLSQAPLFSLSSAISGFKCRCDRLVKSQLKQPSPPNSLEVFFSGLRGSSSACGSAVLSG